MKNTLAILLAAFALLSSCSEKAGTKCMMGIERIEGMDNRVRTPHDEDDEVFAVSCFDRNDPLKMDTLNKLVAQNYSHERAKKHEYFYVTIYNYDRNCENGINSTSDCITEVNKENIAYKEYMVYRWENDTFKAASYWQRDSIIYLHPKLFN